MLKILLTLCIMSSLVDAAAKKQPNIIYINTDDWGIGKVPSIQMDKLSQALIKTPNIDQLKQDGMVFTNSYAGNAVCGASRSSLITGKHPGNAPWRANRKTLPKEVWPVSYPLLGTIAQNSGYTTAGFGKLSPGGHSTPEGITNCGWDYWLGFLGHIDCRDYYNSTIWENGKLIKLPKNTPEVLKGTSILTNPPGSGVVGEGVGTFIEDLYTDKIVEFISENKEKPFFIYLASTVPHGGPAGGMRVPSLEGYDKIPNLTIYEQTYCALMTRHDKNVGRIRKCLKELGLEKDTIIIWTSDNGDEDSYYRRTKIFDGNGPYKKEKRHLYEGGIRTPMIAVWPDTIPANSTSDHITAQWDLMPTLADAGGKTPSSEMDGISMLPTLQGNTSKQQEHKYLYFEFYEAGKQQSVRMGKWKAYRKGGWDAPIEIYNIEDDEGEANNVASQHPELVQTMRTIMKKEHSPHPIWNQNSKAPKGKKTNK